MLPLTPRSVQLASRSAPPLLRWISLGVGRRELTLDHTLPTGQTFRWRRTGQCEYTGVIGARVVKVRQEEDEVKYAVVARSESSSKLSTTSLCFDDDVHGDDAVIRDYFNLGPDGAIPHGRVVGPHIPPEGSAVGPEMTLTSLSQFWASRDKRFASVSNYFKGARMLRQDPVECLFSFICSSNNHISRIHGMVEKLCSRYGSPIILADSGAEEASTPFPEKNTSHIEDQSFYSFPTLDQLAEATEADLRAAGFGYRAKFIVGSVSLLANKEGGGHAWLMGLRNVNTSHAVQELCTLPGIGPKVAACTALFSLDKHNAIPVDTHVWQIATTYYLPKLRGKVLTPKVHGAVQDAFEERFGPFAGWAHNTLFISELASQRDRLPEDLRTPPGQDKPARGKKEKQNSVVTSLLKRKAIKPAALEYDSE